MRTQRSILFRGTLAGFVAALALALFFLIVDALQGRPFATPSFLASALLGRAVDGAGFALIAGYTAIHFLAFIIVGLAIAWLFTKLDARPRTLFGLVVGFLLFDAVFYFGVIVTGVDVARVVGGWPQLLAGNLIAGLVLMNALSRMEPTPKPSWSQVIAEHPILREGVVAGLIGAAAVAIWFLALDAARGQIFFTPAAFGSAILEGARGVAEVEITATTVIGYTVIHILAFLALGLLASSLAVAAEANPPLILGFVLLFVTMEAFFIGAMAIAANWLLGALSWWTIVVANLVAAAAMGTYLWFEHPRLQEELLNNVEEELVRQE